MSLSHEAGFDADEEIEKKSPKYWLEFYKSEREKLRLEKDKRQVIPAIEVEEIAALAFKGIAQTLDTLFDTLERKSVLSEDALHLVQEVIDKAREEMYNSIQKLLSDSDV